MSNGPSLKRVASYRKTMTEIRHRLDTSHSHLTYASNLPDDYYRYLTMEAAALQLRKVVETVAISGFVNNESELRAVSRSLETDDAGDAVKRLDEHHPNWWPSALSPNTRYALSLSKLGEEPRLVSEPSQPHGSLDRDEWGRCFGTLSYVSHVPNPFSKKKQVYTVENLQVIEQKLVSLLAVHSIEFMGIKGFRVVADITSDSRDATVRVQKFDDAMGMWVDSHE